MRLVDWVDETVWPGPDESVVFAPGQAVKRVGDKSILGFVDQSGPEFTTVRNSELVLPTYLGRSIVTSHHTSDLTIFWE